MPPRFDGLAFPGFGQDGDLGSLETDQKMADKLQAECCFSCQSVAVGSRFLGALTKRVRTPPKETHCQAHLVQGPRDGTAPKIGVATKGRCVFLRLAKSVASVGRTRTPIEYFDSTCQMAQTSVFTQWPTWTKNRKTAFETVA